MLALGRKKNILLGTIIGYVSILINILAGLFFTPWIILHFGNSGYGVYSLSISLVSMFLIDFGLSNATTTFLSKYRAAGDTEGISRALSIVYKIYFILDSILLVLFVGLYFGAPLFYKGLTVEEMGQFRNCLIIVSLFSLVSFPCTTFNGILSSHERFVFLKVMDITQRLIFILTTIAVILLKLNLYFLVLSNCVSAFIVCLLKFLFIRTKLKVKPNFRAKITKSELSHFLFYTSWAAVISICSRIAFNLVPNILGVMADSTSITYFNMCSTIEGFVYSICTVAGSFFLPKIAELKHQKDNYGEKLEKLVKRIGKFQFLIISLIFVGFVVVGKDFIVIWMRGDSSYSLIYIGIVILILYQLFDAPQLALRSAIYLTDGGVKKYAIVEIITAVLNISLCILFIYTFRFLSIDPAIAACVSIFISRIVNFVLKNVIYHRLLPIRLSSFWKEAYFKGSFLAATIIVVGIRLNSLLGALSEIHRFLIVGTFVTICFVVCSFGFILNKEDKDALFKMRRQ